MHTKLNIAFRWLLLASSFHLVACAEYWAKPGGSDTEFEATKTACQARSYMQFPPAIQQVMLTSAYTTPVQTMCTGTGLSMNCTSTGGQNMPPVYMPVDQNQKARNIAVRSCLFSAGWQPVKDKAEAIALTNSVPPVAPVKAASARSTKKSASSRSASPSVSQGAPKPRPAEPGSPILVTCRTTSGPVTTTKKGCGELHGHL